ncbi:hypothetical protein [Marinobacter fonticola]|uniref:hypothetical protein n=1 Tax=Marinobacter fonticola TaxID=2603215 RepID=UPI0011E7C734|nr:hypothetical protein [Marinobacter fonticola]
MADYPVKDKNYDLISTLYHAAHGLQNTKHYAKDAESEGDTEAAEFFKEVQQSYQELSDKAKALVKNRLE